MPRIIDTQGINADGLPAVWSPVQWDLTEEERIQEVQQQATASLLWAVDPPEMMLRVALGETEIKRTFDPPQGYDPEQQGEWDEKLITFCFNCPFELVKMEREDDYLYVEYKVGDQGFWAIEISPEEVLIQKI
jgi:hypothetical protein